MRVQVPPHASGPKGPVAGSLRAWPGLASAARLAGRVESQACLWPYGRGGAKGVTAQRDKDPRRGRGYSSLVTVQLQSHYYTAHRMGAKTMPLNIEARWSKPIKLLPTDYGYVCKKLDSVPAEPGAYVFGRTHGDTAAPLYVGRTKNLRGRLKIHLDSVRLMKALYDAEAGARFFMYCTVSLKRGQKLDRVLETLEAALIAQAVAAGFELRQKQGVKRPLHTINFTGNRISEAMYDRTVHLQA
jgi:hypothetical protein